MHFVGPDIGLRCLPMYHKTMFIYCRLIIFANMLDPDQARHLVGPDLDPNCLHSDGRDHTFCGIWFKLSMSHKKDREQ